MSRSGLFMLIGALVLIIAGMAGYMVYQQSREPSLEISVDSGGIRVSGNG